MKVIQVPRYQCSYCEKVYESRSECAFHEKDEHKCPSCEHSYYAYGCEQSCEREDAGKPCRFKKRRIEDEKES